MLWALKWALNVVFPRHAKSIKSENFELYVWHPRHRIKRTGWEHSMGLTLVLVPIHLCRITSSFPKRQADQEILRQVRLSLLKNFASFQCNKTVTLGLMFECMWCKTIMSHPSCSTVFSYHSTRFFAFLAQSQDSTMPGRVPQIHFSLFSPRNGRKMSKGVRLVWTGFCMEPARGSRLPWKHMHFSICR